MAAGPGVWAASSAWARQQEYSFQCLLPSDFQSGSKMPLWWAGSLSPTSNVFVPALSGSGISPKRCRPAQISQICGKAGCRSRRLHWFLQDGYRHCKYQHQTNCNSQKLFPYHTIHIRIPPLFIHHLLQKFIVLIDLRYVPYWNFPDLCTYYISFRPVWVSYDMNYSFFDMKDMDFARLRQRFTSFTTSRAAHLPLLYYLTHVKYNF